MAIKEKKSHPFAVFCDSSSVKKSNNIDIMDKNLDFDLLDLKQLETLNRRDLQSIAKQHGVRANLRSHEIIECLIKLNNENSNAGSKFWSMQKSNVKKRGLSVAPVEVFDGNIQKSNSITTTKTIDKKLRLGGSFCCC